MTRERIASRSTRVTVIVAGEEETTASVGLCAYAHHVGQRLGTRRRVFFKRKGGRGGIRTLKKEPSA